MLAIQAETDAAPHMSLSWAHELCGMQVHAACNGVWGYRASTGTAPADSSASTAGALNAVGWACRHPQDLQLVGEALNLPGSKSGMQPLIPTSEEPVYKDRILASFGAIFTDARLNCRLDIRDAARSNELWGLEACSAMQLQTRVTCCKS